MGIGASIPDTETLDENQCVSNEVEATKNDASDDMEVNKEIKVTEEPEKGNQKEEDTKSMDSKDSNDTYVLAWRMPKYLIEKRQRLQKEKQVEKDGQSESDNQQDPSHAKHPEKNRLAVTSDEHKDSNSVSACEPNTLTNKQETFSDANKLPKSAPCGKDRDNEAGEEQAINCSQAIETGDNECKVSNEKKSDTTVRGSAKTGTSVSNTQKDKTAEKFEEFKKRYGIQLRRRKSLPNKMTLVITRVGTKFQLMTVPAYLPRQRLYRSSSFVKNYIPEEPVFGRRKRALDLEIPSEPPDDLPGTESASKKSRGKKSPGGVKKETKLPACSLPTNMQPTFFVGGGNGVSLVEGPLTSLGWKRTTDKYDERFRLKWVECKSKINYGAFREGEQMVNHLPNSHLLTNKLGLLNSLKEYERVTLSTKGRLPRLKMSEFHPETYKLDEKGDRDLFLEVYKEGEIWICKPIGMNQGKGIFLIRSRESINQILEERDQKKLSPQKPGRPLMTRIVQRYIMNPLLLDGKKFDVRAYMLIASTTPYLILFHKGYVRLSCHKYDQNDMSMSTHLTNQFIQKKDPAYKDLKEETAWSIDKFNDYINDHIRPNSHVEFEEDWVYNTFTKQMQKIMIHCFNSVKHKLQARIGFFDLFGLDFMVDTDMRVWLIEVNTNPALHCNCEALKEVIPGVVEESLFVAIECFEKSKKNLPLMPLQSLKHFTILYCGTRPNTMIPRQSRSVSPVKDNSSTASEKAKPISTGVSSRPSHRLLTQSTPIVAASTQRKSLEKIDSSHIPSSNRSESHYSAKTNSSTASAKIVLPAIVQKSDDGQAKSVHRVPKTEAAVLKLENSTAKSEIKPAKTEHTVMKSEQQHKVIAKVGNDETQAVSEAKNTEISSDVTDNKLVDAKEIDNKHTDVNEPNNRDVEKRLVGTEVGKNSESVIAEEERRASVVDTLTKTQNSLNLATSALGKINISLNQVGLTDSLLEEVRLKMTHADPSTNATKANSAKSARGGRENLDRGN